MPDDRIAKLRRDREALYSELTAYMDELDLGQDSRARGIFWRSDSNGSGSASTSRISPPISFASG
jgi:hypothetical protein